MYNVRLKHYRHGDTQTSIYSRVVLTGKREKDSEEADCLGEGERSEPEPDQEAHERSLHNSLKRAKQNIYDIARANDWEYFITLTFSPDKVDRYDYQACSEKLSKWLNNIRTRYCPDLLYLIVPERHKDGAYHYHGLLGNCDGLGLVPSGHSIHGLPIYNIDSYNLGFTTATQVSNQLAVTKYITKYTTKDLMQHTKGKRKYWCSRNCERPLVEHFLLDSSDKHLLREELVEDALHYKSCEYSIGLQDHMSEYFEHTGLTLCLPE